MLNYIYIVKYFIIKIVYLFYSFIKSLVTNE